MRITLLCTLLLAFILAVPVGADEDESPAARAFEGAWWAETAAGDLDRALELYETVLSEEGPDSIKARALLRIGMVQARLGKTEEAIRTFDRLAKAYPDEKALIAQARERLEKWTAEDLEDSFDEWYRRYQFSPAFQAKVVDLVLRLGTRSPAKGVADEEKELLTIGRAAIPALERHLDTSNETLRAWATSLLLQLGELPPVEALLETRAWWDRKLAWTTLLTLPPSPAAAIRERAGVEDDLGRVFDRVTRGPAAALSIFEDPPIDVLTRRHGRDLMDAILDRPGGEPSVERLASFAESQWNAPTGWASRVLRSLFEQGKAPDELLLETLRSKGSTHRSYVAGLISQGRYRHPDAWRALLDAMLENPSSFSNDSSAGLDAFLKAFGQAEDANLDRAAQAFGRVVAAGGNIYIGPNTSYPKGSYWRGVARLMPAVVATVENEKALRLAVRAYVSLWDEPEVSRDEIRSKLLAWAETSPSLDARKFAAWYLGRQLGDETLDAGLEALPRLGPEAAEQLLRGLQHDMEKRALAWTDARLDAVIRALHRIRAAGLRTHMPVLQTIGGSEAGAARLVERWLQAPEHMVWMSSPMSQYRNSARFNDLVRRGIEERWATWSPEQRLAAVEGLGRLMGVLHANLPFVAWIREQVRMPLPAERADAERSARKALLNVLPHVELEDLRPTFELEDPTQALEAGFLHGLRPTPQAYAAVRGVREHPDAKQRYEFWVRWTGGQGGGPEVDSSTRHVVYRDMLRDPEADTRATAIELLGKLRNMEDVPLLVAALEDESPRVRRRAAQALARAYDRSAIQALVERLDDPDPQVRDEVMKTLETIKKAEEARDYWKEFAKDR